MENLLDIGFLIESFPAIVARLPITIGIAVGSLIISLFIGLATALIKIYQVPVLKTISSFYVSFIRGTPLLVQIYLVFYGIPKVIYLIQISLILFLEFQQVEYIFYLNNYVIKET